MRIVSWNVNGIRAVAQKNFFDEFKQFNADIVCLQETKAQDDQVFEALSPLNNWHIACNSAEKKGYSGVCIISREKPISVTLGLGHADHDSEGRLITAEFPDFYMVNVYVPNSGDGLKRLSYREIWDHEFATYIYSLREKKKVIVTGDFNVAHQPIDLARPKENYNKTSGYTQKEIDGMSLLLSKGFYDAFRFLYPSLVKYSFWSARFGARAKNLGWRLDYFLVDERQKIKDSEILDQIMGSDHCPIVLEL
jgi:exodeoxyribonuclease-3